MPTPIYNFARARTFINNTLFETLQGGFLLAEARKRSGGRQSFSAKNAENIRSETRF